jgi:hypothetical protein
MQVLLGVALVLSQASNQEPPRFGKTNAEILKMGHANWTKFAAEDRMGGSTAAYVGSESVYGEALRERNDRLVVGKPALRKPLTRLRKSLTEYANEFISVGSAVSGGGTMWNLTAAGISPGVEEIVYSALSPAGKGPKRAPTVAQVEAKIAFAELTVRRNRKQIDQSAQYSNMNYAKSVAALKRVRTLRTEALRLVAPMPARTQAAVREFLFQHADLQTGD